MKHPIIIAACGAMLLSACDNSTTPEAVDVPKPPGTATPIAKLTSPMPTLAPGASKQERIDWVNKLRDDYMNGQPGQTPSSSAPADE